MSLTKHVERWIKVERPGAAALQTAIDGYSRLIQSEKNPMKRASLHSRKRLCERALAAQAGAQ